jgi:hypothetical protein
MPKDEDEDEFLTAGLSGSMTGPQPNATAGSMAGKNIHSPKPTA